MKRALTVAALLAATAIFFVAVALAVTSPDKAGEEFDTCMRQADRIGQTQGSVAAAEKRGSCADGNY